jgi:hypothetical protein
MISVPGIQGVDPLDKEDRIFKETLETIAEYNQRVVAGQPLGKGERRRLADRVSYLKRFELERRNLHKQLSSERPSRRVTMGQIKRYGDNLRGLEEEIYAAMLFRGIGLRLRGRPRQLRKSLKIMEEFLAVGDTHPGARLAALSNMVGAHLELGNREGASRRFDEFEGLLESASAHLTPQESTRYAESRERLRQRLEQPAKPARRRKPFILAGLRRKLKPRARKR